MKANQIFSLIFLLLLFYFPLVSPTQNNLIKTVYPSTTITPFDLPEDDAMNFPMDQARPVGDINGDGQLDMLFNHTAADERSQTAKDRIRKSIITTAAGINPEGTVFYDSYFVAIGDYNGDGYDDILDTEHSVIRFGSPEGISTDSLMISYPEDFEFYFADDINNDGKSEILIGPGGSGETMYVFSGPDTAAVIMESGGYPLYFDQRNCFFASYDYDGDGMTELCFTTHAFFTNSRYVVFYYFDKDAQEIIVEQSYDFPYLHEPSVSYTTSFCDINGDQHIDIAHAYYVFDSIGLFQLEVCFGKADDPYFDDPVEVQLACPSRMLYMAGDFNNDGADDWYGHYGVDTIAVFYGHEQVASEGFQPAFYNHGNMQQLLLKGSFSGTYYTIGHSEVFDYNGDNFADLAFNYWSYDNDFRFETIGTAIVLGSDTADFLNPIVIGRSGDQSYQNLKFGYHNKKIKDINQDGYDDWGILSPEGCYLNVYFGGAQKDLEPDIRYLLPQTNKALCFDFTSGDMNGDGYTDIAIANSSETAVTFTRGFIADRQDVYIFFGSDDLQSTYNYLDADVVLHDNDTFYSYGYNLSIVGDYNADGFDDLVVGGGKHRYCLREALVYFGSDSQIGPDPDLVISVPCTQCGILFAHPITPCGDVNADGYDDFTLGDPSNGTGKSLIYFGGSDADIYYDKVLVNPVSNGGSYGSTTAISPGDYNADGYNDLIQYSYFSKEIYIYYGGPDINSQYDLTIYDSTFPVHMPCFDFVDRAMETGASDIVAGFSHDYGFDFYLYQGGEIPAQSPSYLLKNGLAPAGRTVASGDFNNDGIAELFAGISYEVNHGCPYGGIVYYYEPELATFIPNGVVQGTEVCEVFPNPATDIINIQSSTIIEEVEILDANGISIRHFRHGVSSFIQIESAHFNPGLYFLKIKNEGQIIIKKIIISQ